MSLCLQSFNYVSNRRISGCAGKHTKGKKNPALLSLPVDRNTTFPSKHGKFNGSSVTGQGNGVGIIGGVSVDSTLNFAKKLVNLKMEDGENGPPIVLCSDPSLSEDLLSLERSSFPSVLGRSAKMEVDHSLVVENLRYKRKYLEKSGVCCIVMPCHISHSWYDQIAQECSVPFLNIGECVANELKEAKLRPLEAGSPLRIGILATNEAMVARFYQEKLENEGFEAVVLDKATMEHTVRPAEEALKRKDREGAQNLLRIALQVLLVRAVNRVVVACDEELWGLLPADDPLWRRCIDPLDALARSTARYARNQGIK